MQLNGKELISYTGRGDEAAFVLSGTTLEDALDLAKSPLVVTAGGKEVERFEGYEAASVAATGEYVTLRCVRKLDDSTAQAIHALEANVATAKEQAADAKQAAQASADKADRAEQAANAVDAKADEAKDAAAKAQAQAEQAAQGTNPELSTFATMQLSSMAPTMTDEQALSVPSLFPEWTAGQEYEAKQVVRYEGELYRIAQKHTAQEQYKPGAGTESLYTRIVQSGGYDVWQQPTGGHDAYAKGARVWYPTADSQLWESLIDGNTWSPDAYPAGWKKVG